MEYIKSSTNKITLVRVIQLGFLSGIELFCEISFWKCYWFEIFYGDFILEVLLVIRAEIESGLSQVPLFISLYIVSPTKSHKFVQRKKLELKFVLRIGIWESLSL